MKIRRLHGWDINAAAAVAQQRALAAKVVKTGEVPTARYIAGVDVSTSRRHAGATGAVVVLSFPELETVAVSTVMEEVKFPYIPGLLSFREAPLILRACERLEITPDLVICDGQGLAHPRRLGLACHLGLFLDVPAIGCAKSRLVGEYRVPGSEAGDRSYLHDGSEVIGAALRTRRGARPVFVSIGHRIGLEAALDWVLRCCRGYRLPEPVRRAHLAAGGNL